jgi:hypothetical protein
VLFLFKCGLASKVGLRHLSWNNSGGSDTYIRADNDFRQRREEAYRFSEMTRRFGGRIHPRHVRSIHNSTQNDDRGSQLQRS